MRKIPIVIGLFAATACGAGPADAKGCLKGAAVGGVAGHVAGHGVLGAVAGCAVGHHKAAKDEKRAKESESKEPR